MALPQISIGNGMLGTALLASVEITQELNRHWWCSIVCRETEETRIPVEDMLGKSVEITTTDEEGVTSTHFSGFVYDVELDYEIYGSYGARIVAVSKSYLLDQSSYKHYYTAATLSSVASIIGGRTGLTISAKPPARKALNYVQYGETDYAFLLRLADDYGAWVRPTEDGVEILDSFQSGKTVVWRDHDGLTSFSLAASMAPTSVSGSHYDFHAMQSSTFSKTQKQPQFYDGGSRLTSAVVAASQSLPTSFESTRGRAMTVADYDEQLQAESERLMGSAVTGRGSSQYQPLKAGDTVTVQGTLDAAGTYGLTRVVHRWTPKGYSNEFQCTPWKQYRSPKPPAMNTWEGVVPARVVAHNDPKKMGRLQVQFFWQQDSSTHWARMVSPHAGPDRGMMFMPEVGDEVAVMFEDGDPERPIIVGSLWNGVQQAPRIGYFSPTGDIADNNVKRIYTKSGNRLQMIDTPGVESVALATPNSTKLIKTEHDASTGRSLVTLHSEGDIILTAPQGRVHIASKFFSREVGEPADPASDAGGGFQILPDSQVAAMSKADRMKYRASLIAAGRGKAASMPNGPEKQRLQHACDELAADNNRAEMARLSKSVYDPTGAPEGWERLAPENMPSKSLRDPELWRNSKTHFRAGLYRSSLDSSKYVVATGGTDANYGKTDFIDDGEQAFGMESKQYDSATLLANKLSNDPWINQLNSQGNLQVTGHSLGGGEAALIGTKLQAPTTTLNAAGVHPETLRSAGLLPSDVRTVENLETPDQIVGVLQGPIPNAVIAPVHGTYLLGADMGTAVSNAGTRIRNAVENIGNHLSGRPESPMPKLEQYPANQTWRTVFPAAGKQVILPSPSPSTDPDMVSLQTQAEREPGAAIVFLAKESLRRHYADQVIDSIEKKKTAEQQVIKAAL